MGYSSDIFQVWWTSEVHKCVCETCSALCVPKITEIIRFLTKLHVFQKTCFGHSFSRKDYNSLKNFKIISQCNTTVSQPFVWDYSGRPVPEETFTHSHPSWSSDILYQLPLFTLYGVERTQLGLLLIEVKNATLCRWCMVLSPTSKYDGMSHERPCFICFVVWPTTSLKYDCFS